MISHKRLAAQLSRRPLRWMELAELDWVLGARQTPMREQITDFFLRAGIMPPPPFVESLSSKVIGELVAASERAMSIVPASEMANADIKQAVTTLAPARTKLQRLKATARHLRSGHNVSLNVFANTSSMGRFAMPLDSSWIVPDQ